MAKDVTRYIKREVERELWGRSAGRCEFEGCNRLLYKSPVTQEAVNISERAHIYSFSPKGPRGWGPFAANRKGLNDTSNLMLMCHDCHKLIDQDNEGKRYSAQLLRQSKAQHELRIRVVTGIVPNMRSHVVLYGASIGKEKSSIDANEAMEAMFPERYPAEEMPIILSMSCEHQDDSPDYWATEKSHLSASFQRRIVPRIEEANPSHFSLFPFAPQPLLIFLGTLFTDKIAVDVFQPKREPRTWRWGDDAEKIGFTVTKPDIVHERVALVVSLSGKVGSDRIVSEIGSDVSIWEITVDRESVHNDFMQSKHQLSRFRKAIRKLLVQIQERHGHEEPLNIFPAMPIACAIEFGRVRTPKSDMPWVIYDSNQNGKFIKALEIGRVCND